MVKLLALMLLLASAIFAFEFPIEKATLANTSLTGLDKITPQEVYSEITPSGTWHYYLIQPKVSTPALPQIFNGRVQVLEKEYRKGNLGIISKEVEETITVCRDELVCADNSGCDDCKSLEECTTQQVCEVKTVRSYKNFYRFTPINSGSVRLLAIKTRNFDQGSFNPSISGCGNIVSSGQYWLTGDIRINGTTCLNIQAPNVEIDCQGYSIIGNNSTSTVGIYSNQFNTTIRNCQIHGFYEAIIFTSSSSNGLIENTNTSSYNAAANDRTLNVGGMYHVIRNVSSYNSRDAIYLTAKHTLVENSFANGTYSAINLLSTAENVTIRNSGLITYRNGATANIAGINLGGVGRNTIFNNSISAPLASHGIYVTSPNNSIDCQGKSIIGANASGTLGIYSNSANTTIINCQISNFSTGIQIAGATGAVIEDTQSVSTASNGYAITLSGSGHRLSNLNLTSAFRTLALYASYSNVSNVDIVAPNNGICIHSSTNNNFNRVENVSCTGGAPLYLYQSHNGTYINVSKTSSAGSGNVFDSATNNTIINSTFGVGTQLTNNAANNRFIGVEMLAIGVTAVQINGGPNTLIDCQGKRIEGNNAPNTYGVYSASQNTTIRNCLISKFATGVDLAGASFSSVDNITANTSLAYSFPYGMAMVVRLGANDVVVSNSNLTSFSNGAALMVHESLRCNISNSWLSGNTSDGLALYSNTPIMQNNTVKDSLIRSNARAMSMIQSGGNYIENISSVSYGNNHGIYLSGAGAKKNTVVSSYIATNSSGASGYTAGIFLISYSSENLFENNTIQSLNPTVSGSAPAVFIYTHSSNNTFRNNNITTAGHHGVIIEFNATYNSIWNNNISSNNGGIYILSSSDNRIVGNTINSSWRPINIIGASSYNLPSLSNQIIQNTLISPTNTLAYLDTNSSGNVFSLNNFTDTSGLYVQDLNGSNSYNATIDGINQGNIYFNVLDASVGIWGSTPSSINGFFVGNGGRVPYNVSNSNGKISGGVDYTPLTPYSISNFMPSEWSFDLPKHYMVSYYLPNTTVVANYTPCLSSTNRQIIREIYTPTGTAMQYGNDTIYLFYANISDGIYNFSGICYDAEFAYLNTSAISSQFLVAQPTMQINYSVFSIPNNQILQSQNLIQSAEYVFYPSFTNKTLKSTISNYGNVIVATKTVPALNNATNHNIQFAIPPGTYFTQFEVCNIYGECVNSEVRSFTIVADAKKPNESQAIPPIFVFIILVGIILYFAWKNR
ncbi:MAG: right-handed parallel beta-helix repeat-containing protein [candidate division WOR-3 bacterium]